MAVKAYATVEDVSAVGISLSAAEQPVMTELLGAASAKLRVIADKHRFDLESRVTESEDYAAVVKSTVIQAALRALKSVQESLPIISQGTETAGSYSITSTYLNAGQAVYFLKSELKDLGFFRQRYGAIDLYSS